MQRVIGDWVYLVTGLTLGKVRWEGQNLPRPSLPYVGLTRRTFDAFGFDTEDTTEVPVAVTLTVTAAAAPATAKFILGKLPITYPLTGGDDAEAARDALLAQIALSYEPVTASLNSTDKIDILGKGSQALRVQPVEGCTTLETLEYRRHTNGLRRSIVRVELFGFDVHGDEAGEEYADALISSLLTPGEPGSQLLRKNSVGVENQALIKTQNVSAPSMSPGGTRETRLMFDVQFNAASRRFFPENPINAVADPIIELIP